MAKRKKLYAVYQADRSGNSWDVGEFPADDALLRLGIEMQLHPHNAHGIYDPDNPEGGDVQDELEEDLNWIEDACAITSEIDHLHTCPICHEDWWHANDGCEETGFRLFPQYMICPNCE